MRVSYGNSGVAELADGTPVACKYRRSVGRPYCGDRVLLGHLADGSALVTQVLPRRNMFARADARQRKQVIAANLDQVFIVIAPAPEPSRDLVERYLVAAHDLGITPLLVINKAELLAAQPAHPPFSRIDDYRALGYSVLAASTKGPPGIDALLGHLDARVSILAGQSGVGKSSLVNALVPDLDLQTGELSRITGKGTHTTTTTIMYRLPAGGRLLDSPGVWEFGLWQMSATDLAGGFIEFRNLDAACRFRDCRHAGEPGCAVQAAVEAGAIRRWRYQSYLRLLSQSR